jgi:hypothetical protein
MIFSFLEGVKGVAHKPVIVMFEEVYALHSLHNKILPFCAELVATG